MSETTVKIRLSSAGSLLRPWGRAISDVVSAPHAASQLGDNFLSR